MRAGVLEARKQNKPVEVVDAFTETSRTWAFPDGSLKTESYTGPTQAKQGDGSWALIDTTLVEKDGVLKPKVSGAADVAFSLGGGDAPFAVMKRDEGQSFSLSWDKALPRPVVKGNVATYPDAAGPAADLVVTALPTGFRHDVVLRERPKGPLEIRMPVESSELTFAKSRQGGLQLTDGKDKVVAQAPQPVMWDSTGGQDPKAAAVPRRAPISTSVVGDGDKQVLVLKPDTAWLADPATTFPVVVDPTSTLTVKTDTLLSSGADCNVNDQPGATLLKIGAAYYGCNGVDAVNYWRSYLLFDVSSLANKPIISSTMQLWRTQSPDCHLRGNGKIYAGRLNGSWTPRRMTWANKPSTTDFVATPCPTTNVLTPGVMTWPITNWVKDWATGQPNYGIDLEGPTESVDRYSSYSAVFHSAEMTGTGATPPKLITQYILPPEIPTVTAESVDSMDGDHAIVRKSSAKVGYKSTSVDGRNIDYYVSVVDSTAPLPAWTTGGGEVGKWNFTDGTGGSDSSGQGNILTFMDGRYSWIDGKDGKALLLNGTVNAPSSASTSKPVMRTDKSFSAAGWVRLDVGTKTIPLISQSGTVNSAFSVGYDSTSRKWNMQMYHANSGTNLTEIKSSSVAQIGTWTHLVGVYDAVAKKMRLYVNGVLASEADYTATPWNADQMFELGNGRYSGFGYSSVKAAYDEIRAYNRVLSPTEIQWMLALTPPTNANLPSGQAASITYDVSNVDSFKISVKACINGATPITCNESPYYRITTDAPYLPTDTETGMVDPTQPILSGMVNRPSGGPVIVKYYLYDSNGAPVGSAPLGIRTVNGGERASFQLPADTVQPGMVYTWQMVACAQGQAVTDEACTSKTAPVSFITPGTPPPDPVEDVRHLTLGKDSFVIKTAKTGPTACNGSPCAVTDDTVVRTGGTGIDKTVAIIGFKLDELPDGAAISEGLFKLGTPTCPAGTCPADSVITATPLKSPVTVETKGSELAADANTSITPYSLRLSSPQVDIGDSALFWLLLTSNKDEVITFAELAAAEQPSLALTYLPSGPPSKVLNLTASGGDASAIASWGLPESNGGMAMLEGYDVQVTDGDETIVKTLEVKDPLATISGLTNDVTYTIKVRAKTIFGVSDWETATATTKAVPPPPVRSENTTCMLEFGSQTATKSAVSESGAQAYIDQVKAYYQAQDAVLEGHANTIWAAPGVTAEAPNTAKLSLLNTDLITQREALRRTGQVRTNSTVAMDNAVVQAQADGGVRVIAQVKRAWAIQSAAPSVRAARVTSDLPGQVEPDPSTISIFALDRCGGVTIIDVPNPAYEDSTDHHDDGIGGCGASAAALASRSVTAEDDPCSGPAAGPCHTKWGGDKDNNADGYGDDPSSLQCDLVISLGKKGWYFKTSIYSKWHPSRPEGSREKGNIWIIDELRNHVQLYPSSKTAWGWGSSFAKALTKNAKIGATSSGCFGWNKLNFEANFGLGISPKTLGDSSLTLGAAISSDAGEDCGEYNPSDIEGHKIYDTYPGIVSRCHASVLSACEITTYRHALTGSLKFDFTYPERNSVGQIYDKRYTTPTIRSAVWVTAERSWVADHTMGGDFEYIKPVSRYRNCTLHNQPL
ncbi:LamG-like jellyroll fold domain-containing protein [Streptosporangium subroseum]|uniref:LamG-like jellyroll fold domain-containing protein n=1 Tax=Streptosporangium subroseum TaxID=106412 RepID=UPI00308B748A|nr:DNRLRE domain-containing protein [Streptosporangium subroseum]